MQQDSVARFLDAIAPFRKLWTHAHVTTLAMRRNDAWTSIGCRIVLATGNPTSLLNVTLDNFMALTCSVESSRLESLIQQASKENTLTLTRNGQEFLLYLLRMEAPAQSLPRTLSWNHPQRIEPTADLRCPYRVPCRSYAMAASVDDRLYETLPWDETVKLNERIRIRGLGFRDLPHLIREHCPGLVDLNASSDAPRTQIIAPLSFKCALEGESLLVDAPETARTERMEIVVFYSPDPGLGDPTKLTFGESSNARVLATVPLSWPKGARTAKTHLYYNGEDVGEFDFARWESAATVRQVVDLYFDPERKRLRELLLTGKATSEQFEHAVVRLLSLLGISTIWYGSDVEKSRPDGAAVLTRPDQSLVFLTEFTIDKPLQKLSMCKDRARQVRELLHGEAQVVALLVARADVSASHIQSAANDGTVLIGREQIEQLLASVGTTTESETVGYLLRFLTEEPNPFADLFDDVHP